MTKLKLAPVEDDKPVKLTVTLTAKLHRNLVAYAEILAKETGRPVESAKLIAPMLEKFITSDRGFAKAQRGEKIQRARFFSDCGRLCAAIESARPIKWRNPIGILSKPDHRKGQALLH